MSQPSSTARAFAPLAALPLPLFLAATVLVAVVWGTGFGDGVIEGADFKRRVANPDLRAALGSVARALDAAWVTLGAIVAYMALVRTEGLAVARRWGLAILAVSLGMAILSARTGMPLGPVAFTGRLGWELGAVPFGWPFLWLLGVVGAREAALRAMPRASHATVAVVAGVLLGGCNALLEPVAWKLRAWWLWYPGRLDAPAHAPLGALLTWALVGMALVFFMRSPHIVPKVKTRPSGPLIVFAAFLVVVAIGRLKV